VAPGFVDIHIHGGGGGDFMDATAQAVHSILDHHARHGTTSLLATTTTAPFPEIVEAFRERLRTKAGFRHVLEPLPMRISTGAIVYYLFFASQKDVANRIVKHIFKKHADRMV